MLEVRVLSWQCDDTCRESVTHPYCCPFLSLLCTQDIASALYVSLLGGAASYGIFFWLASSKGNLTALSSLTFLTPVSRDDCLIIRSCVFLT